MISSLKQAALIWFLLQLFFGYFEYRYKPDVLYIIARLTNRKYLLPSIIIPITYLVILSLLKYLLG